MIPSSREAILQALMAQQQAPQQPQGLFGMPQSDQDFQSFFQPNGHGGVMGLDQLKQQQGAHHFNMPSYSETGQDYQMPVLDGITDPNWINEYSTRNYY